MRRETMNHHHESEDVGQGKLYSPDHAIKIDTKSDVDQAKLYSPDHAIKITKESSESEEGGEKQRKVKMMLGMKNLGEVKDKVLEKLTAASVPSESLENAKQFLECVIKDFAGAAQGMTKDALHRIKTHLADILPSVSPAVTEKMVDDAEKEATDGEDDERKSKESSGDEVGNNERKSKESSGDEVTGKLPYVAPTSSFFGSLAKPFSRL